MADTDCNAGREESIPTVTNGCGTANSDRPYSLEDRICNLIAAMRVHGHLLPDGAATLTKFDADAIQFSWATVESRFRELEWHLDHSEG